MNLIGDVKGKVAIMVDDMIDTAGMDSSHKLGKSGVKKLFNLCWFRNFSKPYCCMHLLMLSLCALHRDNYKQCSPSTRRRSPGGICLLHTCSVQVGSSTETQSKSSKVVNSLCAGNFL